MDIPLVSCGISLCMFIFWVGLQMWNFNNRGKHNAKTGCETTDNRRYEERN